MSDPTAKIREKIIDSVVPGSSPLGQSVQKAKEDAQAQLATDEANNLVLQRPAPVLPQEAAAFVNPVAPAQVPATQEFINPGQTQATPQRAPADLSGLQVASNLTAPAIGVPDQSKELNSYFSNHDANLASFQSEEQKLLAEKSAAIQAKIDEDDKNVEKIEPKGFFTGKSTWQKILGGVGMFLGSLTSEGAKNVASIIDNEINRDIEAQKANIKLKQDKSDKNFQRLMDRYGSQEAALLAKKRDAFSMLDVHLKKLELNARNAETKARLAQGREELALKKQAIGVDLLKASLKQNQEAAKGMIPGFSGSNQNPTIVKDLTERIAAQRSANSSIDQLENLLKEGSLIGKNRELAVQVREKLAADMAKAMFGRSSDSELEVARGLIPDVTSIMQRGSVDKDLLENLRKKLAEDVRVAAEAAGFTQIVPVGARKIQ